MYIHSCLKNVRSPLSLSSDLTRSRKAKTPIGPLIFSALARPSTCKGRAEVITCVKLGR